MQSPLLECFLYRALGIAAVSCRSLELLLLLCNGDMHDTYPEGHNSWWPEASFAPLWQASCACICLSPTSVWGSSCSYESQFVCQYTCGYAHICMYVSVRGKGHPVRAAPVWVWVWVCVCVAGVSMRPILLLLPPLTLLQLVMDSSIAVLQTYMWLLLAAVWLLAVDRAEAASIVASLQQQGS